MTLVQPSGLGGGGAMYSPAVSPLDPFFRCVACDMGGLYRTLDGGANWEMLDMRQMTADTAVPVVFHPILPDTIFAYSGARRLRRSDDRGTTWTRVTLGSGWASTDITALAIDGSGRLFVGTKNGAHFLDGSNWIDCRSGGTLIGGEVVKFVRWSSTAAPMYLATKGEIFRSDAGLTSWTPASSGLPAGFAVRDFAGGTEPGGVVMLYLALPSTGTGAVISGGGVWVSNDGGASWTSAMTMNSGLNLERGTALQPCEWPQYEHLAALDTDTRTAYVTVCAARTDNRQYRLYKTTTGGSSWSHVMNVDATVPNSTPTAPNVQGGWQDFSPFGWGNSGRGHGLAVGRSLSGPGQHAVLFTNNAIVYASENGASTWRQCYTRQYPLGQGAPGADQSWRSVGLEVTSTWNYYISEDDPTRHFICYTDIGFGRSIDDGRSWYDPRPNGHNSIYELEFDAAAPAAGQRRIWAAASDTHDLPDWGHLYDDPRWANDGGEVMTSTDGGASWAAVGTLPIAQVVSIVSDRRNPPPAGARRLWAGLWSEGVYRLDSGAWTQKNGSGANLLGNPGNLHVHRLSWHDDGSTNGLLFCLITGFRPSTTGALSIKGGLWRSGDAGESWTCITTHAAVADASYWARDFVVDPNDATGDTIFLTTGYVGGTVTGRDGGLFVTADGGSTWREIDSFRTSVAATPYHPDWINAFAPFVDPQKPKKLWVTTSTHGLWVSEDATVSTPAWAEYRNLPFLNTQRLSFPRGSSPELFVTSFGGGIFRIRRQLFFIEDRSAFSEFDVAATPVIGGKRTFKDALYLVLDGFLPSELGIPAGPAANVPASAAPILEVKLRSTNATPTDCNVVRSSTTPLLAEIDPIPDNVAQRFTFVFDVAFSGANGQADFPATGEDHVDVRATKDGWLSAQASIKLFRQANPFMLDGPIPWLSQDLRVFRITRGGAAPWPGAPSFVGSSVAEALAYLKQVVTDFNMAPVSSAHSFNAIPDSVLTLLPQTSSGDRNFNCAIARVRFVPATTPTADQLRVLFRSFRTQSTSLDYRPSATYRSGQNSATPPDLIPLLGVVPATGSSYEVVSIPFFDEPRVGSSQPLTEQTEPTKFQLPAGGGVEQWRFFGALLDFNQQEARFPETVTTATLNGPWPSGAKSLQELVRGQHQCLVAEISYPPDPIGNGATPASNENIAQRNLAISESANPGTLGSRTVHHTFEIIQTRQSLTDIESEYDPDIRSEELWGEPDEMMIRWLDLPRGARATLYLNRADAARTLQLAAGRVGRAMLQPRGAEGVACDVAQVTYIPLPPTRLPIPVLLTLELPEGVRRDDLYRVVIRQVSGETRAVVGTFELSIPVRHARELLWDEEDKLATLRWVDRSLDERDRWSPVLQRYIAQTADRVRGFGGNPDTIFASPEGAGGRERPRRAGCLARLALRLGLVLFMWCLVRRARRRSARLVSVR